jgi:hypothetical protein
VLTPLPRFPSCGRGGFGGIREFIRIKFFVFSQFRPEKLDQLFAEIALAAAYRISARQDTVYQRGYPCVQLCILYICRIFMGGSGIAQYPHNFMFGQNIAVIERQKQ